MKLTTKGQVTIPKHIRRFLGVAAHSEVEFRIRDGRVVVEKADSLDEPVAAGSRFEALRGSRKAGLSTDQWLESTRGD